MNAELEENPRRLSLKRFAFVTAFLVVVSSELVRTINEALGNMVILLMLSISFMLLVGSFHKGDEEFFLNDTYKNIYRIRHVIPLHQTELAL